MSTSTQPRWAVGAPEQGGTALPPKKRGWSWRVGSIAGIDLYVHATFVLLLAWIALRHWLPHKDVLEALDGVVLITSVFAVVVLHELGHALVARRFGIRTFDITLLPIGGIARLERMPDDPKQELFVAIAGPAVNVALALALFGAITLLGGSLQAEQLATVGGSFLTKMMWINVGLAVFNLLPAFPMDGGRVFRALLAMRMSHLRATDYAARLGQFLALGLGMIGLVFNPMLVLVALFVWMGARQEAASEHVRFSLHGITVGQSMISRFRILSPEETIAHAVEHVLSGFQDDFPVVNVGTVVGVLTRADLLRAVATGVRDTRVEDLMRRDFVVGGVDEPVTQALQRLNTTACHAIPIVEGGVLVGLLTPERVGEIVMMRGDSRAGVS
jgi:Zn-dependent protease/CBS domain-containing protein